MSILKNQNYQEFMHTHHFKNSDELAAFSLNKCENHNGRVNSGRVCRFCEAKLSTDKYHRNDVYKLCKSLSCRNRQLNIPCFKISICTVTNVSDFYESRKHENEASMCVMENTASSMGADTADAMSVDSTETDVLKPGFKMKTIRQHLSVTELQKRKRETSPEKNLVQVSNPRPRYILPNSSQQDQNLNSSMSSIVTQSNKSAKYLSKISKGWIQMRVFKISKFLLYISLIDETLKETDCILTNVSSVSAQIKIEYDEDTSETKKFIEDYQYTGDAKRLYLSSYIISLFDQLNNLPLDMKQNYLKNIFNYFDGLRIRYWDFEKWKIKRKCTIGSLEKLLDVFVNDGNKYKKMEIEDIVKEARSVVLEDHKITNQFLSTIRNYEIGNRVNLKIDLINLVNTCGNFNKDIKTHTNQLKDHLDELKIILVEDLFFDIIFI